MLCLADIMELVFKWCEKGGVIPLGHFNLYCAARRASARNTLGLQAVSDGFDGSFDSLHRNRVNIYVISLEDVLVHEPCCHSDPVRALMAAGSSDQKLLHSGEVFRPLPLFQVH